MLTLNTDLKEVVAQDVRGLSKEAFGCRHLLRNILQTIGIVCWAARQDSMAPVSRSCADRRTEEDKAVYLCHANRLGALSWEQEGGVRLQICELGLCGHLQGIQIISD